jgi:hypothetical protein
MLCEERGFFLEIADTIRGFGLTILKGLMELRDGKIMARFLVEVEKKYLFVILNFLAGVTHHFPGFVILSF